MDTFFDQHLPFYNNAHLLSKNLFFVLHPNILLLTYYCIVPVPAVIFLYEPLKYIPFLTSCQHCLHV